MPHLDCCDAPLLVTIRQLYQAYHDEESVKRCETCGCHWYYRFHERVNFAGDDDWTDLHNRLTPDEARVLLEADKPDLAFLKTRRGILKDRAGVREVNSQPTPPRS